jgi:hypothetical protein
MLDTSKLNKVARIIIECFVDAGYDEPYIYSKIDRLESFGQDQWSTFRWASSQLDSTNKAKFAQKVGVDMVMLMTAFQVIESVDDS